MPLIACAVIVAAAAPAHPHFSTTIQNRSRKIFNIAKMPERERVSGCLPENGEYWINNCIIR